DFKSINAAHRDAFVDQVQAYSLYYPAVELLSSIAIALVVWRGGHAIFHDTHILGGTVTLGVLIAFMQYAQRFFRPIQDLSEKYNILQAAMASSERIFKLLDTPAEVISPAAPKKSEGRGRIEFDHVWFAYRNVPLKEAESNVPAAPSITHES